MTGTEKAQLKITNQVQMVLNKITKKYQEITYVIKESKSTSSVYVTLKYLNNKRTIRIGDHCSYKGARNYSVNYNNSLEKMEKFFKNTIKMMLICDARKHLQEENAREM